MPSALQSTKPTAPTASAALGMCDPGANNTCPHLQPLQSSTRGVWLLSAGDFSNSEHSTRPGSAPCMPPTQQERHSAICSELAWQCSGLGAQHCWSSECSEGTQGFHKAGFSPSHGFSRCFLLPRATCQLNALWSMGQQWSGLSSMCLELNIFAHSGGNRVARGAGDGLFLLLFQIGQ